MEVEIQNPLNLEEATHIANLYDTITFNTRNPYQANPTYLQVTRPLNQTSAATTPMDLSAIATPPT